MKRLFSFALLIGIVTAVVQYLDGDTAAGEWHDAPDAATGL
jgi:hypothetical protein